MSGMIEFDEEASRAIEAVYKTPDVVEQRRVILEILALQPGERVLDIGCGPGLLACEMAEAIGDGGAVHGVDPSQSMLAIARTRTPAPAATLEFSEGDALSLPFPDRSFDVAVSTQVYEYVEDMPAALAEARRVLVPGGRLAILDTDWDSVVWRANDEDRMARVMKAWDEHLAHRDLPRHLPQLLREAGFTLDSCVVVPILTIGYQRETYSGGILEFVAAFVPGRQGVTEQEAKAWANDLKSLGDDYFFSSNRYLFVSTA